MGRHRCVARSTANPRCAFALFARLQVSLFFQLRTVMATSCSNAKIFAIKTLMIVVIFAKEASSTGSITTTGILAVQTRCLRRNNMLRMMTDSPQISRCPQPAEMSKRDSVLDTSRRLCRLLHCLSLMAICVGLFLQIPQVIDDDDEWNSCASPSSASYSTRSSR